MLSFAIGMTISCGDDDNPDPDPDPDPDEEVSLDALNALITEAEGLLEGAEEGFALGNYAIGSIAKLQGVLDDAKAVVELADVSADLVENAETQLQAAIDEFIASEVTSAANPWVQQVAGNRINITDNIAGGGTNRGLLGLFDVGKSFTVELKVNPVSLERISFSNSLMSAAKQYNAGSTVDDGWHVRYFDDGSINFINGAPGGGWSGISGEGTNNGVAPGSIKAGEWNHVAYVHNSGGDKILYVNGTEIGRAVLDYQSITENDAEELGLSIGNSWDWQDRVSNAMYKDIRVWSIALDEADLDQQGLTGTGNGLEAWFPLESDQGAEVADVSGNYLAVMGDLVVWAPNGDPDQVDVDYSELETLISDAETFLAGITEGTNAGDHGIGTTEWLEPSIAAAQAVIDDEGSGADVAAAVADLSGDLAFAETNTVVGGAADGFRNDGGDGYVYISNYTTVAGESFTMEFEFKPTVLGGDIVGNGSYGVYYTGDGDYDSLQYYYNFKGETGDGNPDDDWSRAMGETDFVVDTWYHVALVYDGANDVQTLYVDGVEIRTLSNVGDIAGGGWGGILIGASWGYTKATFRDFRVWNEAKAAADLDADITDPSSEANLEAYAPFNFKDAPLTKDATGKHFLQHSGEIIWNE